MQNELSVKSESIQTVFGLYSAGRLIVNRRYQRKLVWTLEEKQSFIDSILQGFPVPIFLLAETTLNDKDVFEIIDGMQRLNAIMSFIENDFAVNKKYFNLETMVETKELLDAKQITQKKPVLSRQESGVIAKYILPLSIYSFDNQESVDEVFRRINANGRHLSKQELRSAGAIGKFPTLVRRVAEEIRGDTSQLDTLPLSSMKTISINNKNLDYGIDADSIYWVHHGIITKEMLRDSRDEEVVANCIAYMSLTESMRTSADILDELYGFVDGEKSTEIEIALKQIDPEIIREQFLKTHDIIANIFEQIEKPFKQYALNNTSQSVPRYYETVFLAFYDLIYRENKEVKDFDRLKKKLKNIGEHITITTGGNWSAINRHTNIESVKGILRDCFKKRKSTDPITSNWVTEFKSLLTQANVEQSLYDFKQGFCRLDKNGEFDEGAFAKVVKTLTAMANFGPDASGYVCIGVADGTDDAEAIKRLYKIKPEVVGNFIVTGIDHEISKSGKSQEEWFKWIIGRLANQPVPENFKNNVSRNARLIKYKDKSILILCIKNYNEAVSYDDEFFERLGPQVIKVKPANYQNLFARFLIKR